MKPLLRVVAGVVCALLAGCHGGVETDVLERELRLQEDYIWQLEEKLDEYELQLHASGQVDPVKKAPAADPRADARQDDRPSTPADESPFVPPTVDIDLGTPSEPPEGPQFDPSKAGDGETAPPEPNAESGPSNLNDAGGAGRTDADSLGHRSGVDAIGLSPQWTGGYDEDGKSGDEGLTVVVEPRAESGRLVRPRGTLSLMLVKATADGPTTRVARWDFASREVAARWRDTDSRKGLVLELPWTEGHPGTGPLRLWARLVTEDGRKLLASLDMAVSRHGVVEPAVDVRSTARQTAREHLSARGDHGSGKTAEWTRRKEPVGPLEVQEPPPHVASSQSAPRDGPDRPASRPDPPRPVWSPYR